MKGAIFQRAELLVFEVNIGNRGIDVLVYLLNSQAKSVFSKPLCTDFTPKLGLLLPCTVLYHSEDLLTERF